MLDLTYYKMMEHLGFEENGSTVVIPTSCTIQYYDERLLSYFDTRLSPDLSQISL